MKKCDTCIYRNKDEYHKPCIVYREDCEFYERERDMTREEAIELLKEELQTSIDNKEDFADIDGIEKYNESLAMAIKALEQEPKTGHWIKQDNTKEPLYGWYFCSECNSVIGDKTKFCSNCGCRMVEPQESEDKE